MPLSKRDESLYKKNGELLGQVEVLKRSEAELSQQIRKLKVELEDSRLSARKAEVALDIYRQKHRGLLREFRALKDLLRHLGSAGTEVEWQDHEAAQE